MAISHFHPTIGGAERQALLLAQTLVQRGWRVQVLTHEIPGQRREETINGVTVHRRVRGAGFSWLYTITYIRSWMREMQALRDSFDIVHCHQIYYHGLAGARMKKRFGKHLIIKCVSTGDLGDAALIRRKRFGRMTLNAVRRAATMLCISRAVAEDLRRENFSDGQLRLIPNGVDAAHFNPGPETMRDGNEILYTGRFSEVKNLPVLLTAFQQLLKMQPHLNLTLIGAGEGREHVDQIIAADEALRKRVRVISDESNLLPYYQRCGLFVLSSRVEGLSNALLEAMACGCPCVATAVGGNLDLLDPGGKAAPGLPEPARSMMATPHGMLVRPGDATALADAIAHMLHKKEERAACGRRAREFIERHYDIESIVKRIEGVYMELFSGVNRP